MKKLTKILIGSALLVCAMLVGAFFAIPLLASAHGTQATTNAAGTPNSNTYCVQYQQDLAGKLNVSVQTLQQDRKAAFEDELNQIVKNGKLTQNQANTIKTRVESRPNCAGTGNRYENAAIRGFLGKYRSDIVASVASDLHISQTTLTQELHSGQSLAQIAKAHNVTLTQLHTDVFNAVKSAESKAIGAGDLTQAQANDLNTLMQNHPNYVNRILVHHFGKHTHSAKKSTTTTTTSK